MRVVANIADANIVNVEKTPEVGDSRNFNGKFVVSIPEMVAVDVNSSSYVLPVDGGDVLSQAMASLLTTFPMYSNAVFNPLLSPGDIADLDLTAVFTPTGDITRAIVGRGAGPLPVGLVPNVVGVLPMNSKLNPPPGRPGVLISDTIDIGPLTGGAGADEFMVYWVLLDLSTSNDVTSPYGGTAGLNEPAVRSISESDPNPTGFEVYLSHDDGANYILMDRLVPTDFTTFGTLLRIAFRNTGTDRRYVACYAILF